MAKFNLGGYEEAAKTMADKPKVKETTVTAPVINEPEVFESEEPKKPVENNVTKAEKKAARKTAEKKAVEKHAGGRPKKERTRRQYTLTLFPNDYDEAMDVATKEDISFAKLVEKALRAYIDNPISLREEDRLKATSIAEREGITFSKLVEKALLEYVDKF